MIRMEQHLKTQGWTQAEAAKRLGITQPRVSRLIRDSRNYWEVPGIPLAGQHNKNVPWAISFDLS